MRSVGAHEVLVENPKHDRQLWNASDAEIEQFLRLAAQRIQDLKRDAAFQIRQHFQELRPRCRAGIRASHLAAHRDHFRAHAAFSTNCAPAATTSSKKSAAFSATSLPRKMQQDLRVLEIRGDFVALCPYAPRVPYETWILPRTHEALSNASP